MKKQKNTDIDVVISSFPCQSFSIAGKKKGFEDEKNGSLYDHQYKLIKKVKPKIVIYENVKNITNKKFGAIEKITDSMEKLGYTCFHKVLNSLDFGMPQNRERWFMVRLSVSAAAACAAGLTALTRAWPCASFTESHMMPSLPAC